MPGSAAPRPHPAYPRLCLSSSTRPKFSLEFLYIRIWIFIPYPGLLGELRPGAEARSDLVFLLSIDDLLKCLRIDLTAIEQHNLSFFGTALVYHIRIQCPGDGFDILIMLDRVIDVS